MIATSAPSERGARKAVIDLPKAFLNGSDTFRKYIHNPKRQRSKS